MKKVELLESSSSIESFADAAPAACACLPCLCSWPLSSSRELSTSWLEAGLESSGLGEEKEDWSSAFTNLAARQRATAGRLGPRQK